MGVPKFFRYISERYPCLSEFCLEDKIPEFDNLYLDMNGIIHNCSHPDDANVHFRISEETIFRDIFKYIDKLFYLIKPNKLFFMAVDGVAPRAKMNQQRGRRFRSSKEAELLEKNAQKRGEQLPNEARFDSNCITPGTEFMTRLQEALKSFIRSKVSTNPLWSKCRIILSGHETPGEGEHKIMDYIRYMKSLPNYDSNARHCLYGLDADLIILGLCTHELQFSLLREEVKFGRKSKATSLEDTRFFLLHLGLLREYLELEFHLLKEKIPDFDMDKIIDDWVLMGFLVGNDFIPHLPNLHITSNALPILYKAYITVRSTTDGYINESGVLNLERLEKYFEILAETEKESFREVTADLKYLQAKQSNGQEVLPEAFDFDVDEIKNSVKDEDLAKLMMDTEMFCIDSDDENMLNDQLEEEEFAAHKKNYYIEKLNYEKVTSEVIVEQTECYVRALQWILYYYYRGVPSWEWFYPHHYAPFVSDLKNFKHLKIEFDIGKPFLPFEQLLAVLPAASKELLPEAFRDLMTDSKSELIEYYPKDFKTDLNGKKQDWEAVVLIPFIDEKKLLHAMEPCLGKLSEEEIRRNKHGPMLQYDYLEQSKEKKQALKTVSKASCTEKEIWRDEIAVPDYNTTMMNKPEVLRDSYFPGFPTMKHLKYRGELRNIRVRVFDQPSRNESMVLIPEIREEHNDLYFVAKKYLNKEISIGWPHLLQGKVIAVSTAQKKISSIGEKEQDSKLYDLHCKGIREHHMNRMAIDFQDLSVLVHVLPSAGTKYELSLLRNMTLKKIWSETEIVYPAQGIVSDISIYGQHFILHKRVEDVFPVDSKIFMLGQPYLGSEGKVLDPSLVYSSGRLQISLTVFPDPDFEEAKRVQSQIEMQYINSYEASRVLGIQPNCLARITGSIFVIEGIRRDNLPDNTTKMNIGLQLKFPKNNEELVGYMRKVNNIWLYSSKAVNLVNEYYNYFPKIFELISSCNSKDIYFESDLFPDQVDGESLRNLISWLKSQDHNKAERIPCGTKIMEEETVEAVKSAIYDLRKKPVKSVKLQVKPHLILKSGLKTPDLLKNRKRPLDLFDRVIVVKNTYQVPLGHKGTIVAIHPLTNLNSVRLECVKEINYFYDILFDNSLPDGLDENRIFKISENSILQMCAEDTRKVKNRINDNSQMLTNNENPSVSYSSIVKRNSETNKKDQMMSSAPTPLNINMNLKSSIALNEKEIGVNNTSCVESLINKPIHTNQHMSSKSTNSFKLISKQDFLMPPTSIDEDKNQHQNSSPSKKQENINSAINSYPPPPMSLKLFEDNMQSTSGKVCPRKKEVLNASIASDTSKEENSTSVLKKILKINSFNTTCSNANQNQICSNRPSINVVNLPQPPSNWRTDASSKHPGMKLNTSLGDFSRNPKLPKEIPATFNHQHHPAITVPSRKYSELEKGVRDERRTTLSAHNGPPYCMKKSGIDLTRGEGAFIPLQALKNLKKKRDVTLVQSSNRNVVSDGKEGSKGKEVSETHKKVLDLPPKINCDKKATTAKTSSFRGRPRRPKIAAKFDNEFVSH